MKINDIIFVSKYPAYSKHLRIRFYATVNLTNFFNEPRGLDIFFEWAALSVSYSSFRVTEYTRLSHQTIQKCERTPFTSQYLCETIGHYCISSHVGKLHDGVFSSNTLRDVRKYKFIIPKNEWESSSTFFSLVDIVYNFKSGRGYDFFIMLRMLFFQWLHQRCDAVTFFTYCSYFLFFLSARLLLVQSYLTNLIRIPWNCSCLFVVHLDLLHSSDLVVNEREGMPAKRSSATLIISL